MAMLLVTMVSAPLNFIVQLPMLGVGYREFCAVIWRPIVASVLVWLAVAAALHGLAGIRVAHPVVGLIVGTGTGFSAYALASCCCG